MSNAFTDPRQDPAAPVALTPRAASDGGPDSAGAGVGVDWWLQLGASLGSLADAMQADRDDRDERRLPPSNEQLFSVGIFPPTGDLILDLGAVPLGHVWQVRRLIVGGPTVTSPAAGQAYAFAQGAPPVDLNLTNCVEIWTTMPEPRRYGTHQLFLIATEHLFVVVAGGDVGEQYAASARVEDWHFGAFSASQFSE